MDHLFQILWVLVLLEDVDQASCELYVDLQRSDDLVVHNRVEGTQQLALLFLLLESLVVRDVDEVKHLALFIVKCQIEALDDESPAVGRL